MCLDPSVHAHAPEQQLGSQTNASDEHRLLRRAYEKFDLPILSEGLCGCCGRVTFNPCAPVRGLGVVMSGTSWLPLGGLKHARLSRKVSVPSLKAAKSRAFSCTTGRQFAATLLSRRECHGFVSFRIGTFQYYGGRFEFANGVGISITETMIDAAFKSKRLRAMSSDVDESSFDERCLDVSQSEDAWVSHWRRRCLEGAIKMAPKAEVLWRLILISIAHGTPNIEPDVDD